jgi:hypothetical protein
VADRFGYGVALTGDTLVVGAYGEDSSVSGGEGDNSASGAGAAYVFTRSGAVWSQQAYLKASNAEASDLFGYKRGGLGRHPGKTVKPGTDHGFAKSYDFFS